MRRLLLLTSLILGILLVLISSPAVAQTYYFSLDQEFVNVYWEADGSMRVEYLFVFSNDSSADPMEFVDVGLMTSSYDIYSAEASVDGHAINHIAPSEFVSPGIELGLGSNAIQPGASGQVWVSIGGIKNVLYIESTDSSYASAVFSPTWFGSDFVYGTTDLTVIFHLPPSVQPEEPRWHAPPSGWPQEEPESGFDSSGRIIYIWQNHNANGYTQYKFGASFPASYVPVGSVQAPSVSQQLGIPEEAIIAIMFACGFVLLFGGFIALGVYSSRRRKLAYLPPKISIEGHGIKRGLTAVESAVLLETPLDRVLTMILFSLIKKDATRVVSEEPLKIERISPQPEKLRAYETEFLKAMIDMESRKRRKALQKGMVDLVKAVQKKMKGFSLRETRDYYKSIIKKAWQQVEEAETPEVRSKLFDESLEWTMLDRNFEDRTQRTFRTGPVFVPLWWGHYRPSYSPRSGTGTARASRAPSGTAGRGMTVPRLPGSEFAASMVTGVQNTAQNLVSNVVSFTNNVTKTTNPPPPPSRSSSSRSSGGGSSCACACACAGCACACAGGGR